MRYTNATLLSISVYFISDNMLLTLALFFSWVWCKLDTFANFLLITKQISYIEHSPPPPLLSIVWWISLMKSVVVTAAIYFLFIYKHNTLTNRNMTALFVYMSTITPPPPPKNKALALNTSLFHPRCMSGIAYLYSGLRVQQLSQVRRGELFQ